MPTVLMLVVFCDDVEKRTAVNVIRETLPDAAIQNLHDRRQELVVAVPQRRAKRFQGALLGRPEIAKCEQLP